MTDWYIAKRRGSRVRYRNRVTGAWDNVWVREATNTPIVGVRPYPRRPGVNVDRIDIAAGLRELTACGYTGTDEAARRTRMVITYALQRWQRGEEAAAERAAIDRDFHGIDFTSWRRLLAASRAAAEQAAL